MRVELAMRCRVSGEFSVQLEMNFLSIWRWVICPVRGDCFVKFEVICLSRWRWVFCQVGGEFSVQLEVSCFKQTKCDKCVVVVVKFLCWAEVRFLCWAEVIFLCWAEVILYWNEIWVVLKFLDLLSSNDPSDFVSDKFYRSKFRVRFK